MAASPINPPFLMCGFWLMANSPPSTLSSFLIWLLFPMWTISLTIFSISRAAAFLFS